MESVNGFVAAAWIIGITVVLVLLATSHYILVVPALGLLALMHLGALVGLCFIGLLIWSFACFLSDLP